MTTQYARTMWAVALVCAAEVVARAQAPDALRFEVASVKPASRELLKQRGLACGLAPGGKFMAFGTAEWLIACAYKIPPARKEQEIVGGPSWLDVDLFEVRANTPLETIPHSQSEGLAMLKSLLADRFRLSTHRETKQTPIYELVLARRDGKLGPGLRHASETCASWIASGGRGAPPPSPSDQPPCFRQSVAPSLIRWTAMSLSHLADMLSPRLQRPVQDRTGLSGYFDLELQWQPEPAAADQTGGALPDLAGFPTTISTALQEQLGLKLQPGKAPLDVLVIDRIERPSEN
jgi:uncharacterized protein (TIGR03435 family)